MCSNYLKISICSTRVKSECFASRRSPIILRVAAPLRLQSISVSSSEPLVSPTLISTVGSSPVQPQLSQFNNNLTQRHLLVLNFFACSVAISATCLFCSAIPTLLAFKRAAESMAKLMDVTREELPGTMAAVRLSGLEISDLTMELSDLGQQIIQGVRGSTRLVSTPSASVQEVVTLETKTPGPSLAKSARSMKETIVKGRALWKMFFTLTRFSRMAQNYFASRGRSKL